MPVEYAPFPWTIEKDDDGIGGLIEIWDDRGEIVAFVDTRDHSKTGKNNARLIIRAIEKLISDGVEYVG